MIYRKSSFGHRVNFGGHRECPETTGGVPGVHRVGPPIPVGPLGRKGEGASPWWAGAPLGPPLHAPRVETLGEGAPHMPWGASFPHGPPPPLADGICQGRRPPWPLYIVGGEGSRTQVSGASPPPVTPPSPYARRRRSPAGFPAASTTTPSCCWISDDLSSPLAGSRRR